MVASIFLAAGCSSGRVKPAPDAGVSLTDSGTPCVGLACQQMACGEQPTTSITGTVYAPNGTLPLYNVAVYIPNAPLDNLHVGVSCDQCGTPLSGSPIVKTLSDYKGHFKLDNVPAGTDIPLVIQLGKWRRVVSIPTVTACQENKLADANLTRLPKKQSEGDMPKIAVTVGYCDQISCLLPKVGIDSSEFGVAGQDKAVTFYAPAADLSVSGPSGMTGATALWTDVAKLSQYDMLILSCECDEAQQNKGVPAYKAMTQYLATGGRIFTTDFQYVWYKNSTDAALRSIGTIPGGAPGADPPVIIDTSFPKGKALADWMKWTKLSSSYAQVNPTELFDNFSSLDKTKTQTWASSSGHPRFLTINTPVGMSVDKQCGKAVHLDAHINTTDSVDQTFPSGCVSPIGESEGAFAFFFFDLASCIQDDSTAPIL